MPLTKYVRISSDADLTALGETYPIRRSTGIFAERRLIVEFSYPVPLTQYQLRTLTGCGGEFLDEQAKVFSPKPKS